MSASIPGWLGNAYIAGCMQDSNTILGAIITFLTFSNTMQEVWKLSDVWESDNSTLAVMNQKCTRNNVYLSLCA